MDWLLSSIIFIAVLFIYIHVYHHLSTSSDSDVFTVINIPSDKLEELCGSKQPFVAKNDTNPIHLFAHNALAGINTFSIRNTINNTDVDIPPLNVSKQKAERLFSAKDRKDGDPRYYSSGNWSEASDAIGQSKQHRDDFFAPPMTVFSKSDFIVGENSSTTPFRYEIAHRTYLYVFDANVSISLVPPDHVDAKDVISDYELLEFRSSSKIQKGSSSMITVDLVPGDTFYVPPHWLYSATLENHAKIHVFQYYTALNIVSTIHHHALHGLQVNNVKMSYDSKTPIDFGPCDGAKNDQVVGQDENVSAPTIDPVPELDHSKSATRGDKKEKKVKGAKGDKRKVSFNAEPIGPVDSAKVTID